MMTECPTCGVERLVDDRGVVKCTAAEHRRRYRLYYYHNVVKNNPRQMATHREQARVGMARDRVKKRELTT